MTQICTSTPLPAAAATDLATPRLPLAGLLALATAGFITILMEALPAGLLAQISRDMAVSEAMAGQMVTIYALGSLLAAIPLAAATRGWRRRPLLQTALCGFVVVNTVTAFSDNYLLTLAARFIAGVCAGLLWALLAGFASRMVADSLRGRAIAVTMVGIPLALSLGIPFGTLLGSWIGWRYTFGSVSILTLMLIAWVQWRLPDFAGQAATRQIAVVRVLGIPGVAAVLGVTFGFVLAHNMLYTYIAPFLNLAAMPGRIDLILFIFGAMAFVGIWITGVGIDRWLRRLVLFSTLLFMLATLAFGIGSTVPAVIYVATAAWGLAFGGAATLFQTAIANAAGDAADVGQSMIVTVWNLAIAGGGALGGAVLDIGGAQMLPWALLILLLPAWLIAWRASGHGFPHARPQ